MLGDWNNPCSEDMSPDEKRKVLLKRWKGPGVVTGQDGAVVFVRHGGILVRVHHLRLNKVHTQDPTSVQDEVHNEDKIVRNQETDTVQDEKTGVNRATVI